MLKMSDSKEDALVEFVIKPYTDLELVEIEATRTAAASQR